MKKTLLITFLILNLTPLKAENAFTAQIPDQIELKGVTYNLNSNPLEPYFDKFPDKRPKGGTTSTALWRGYVACFKVLDNHLYVTDIKIEVPDKNSKKSYPYKWTSVFNQVFPKKEKVKIDWYTGILILPHGKIVDYVHMGYASTFSKYLLLEIEKGKLNEIRKYKHKEFIRFKKRQFNEFKKTDNYKKLYKELKKNDSNENFIQSFIRNFVTEYTTKFLTN
ncbi:hypothetical protein [Tenacibaculum aestuarii]|uniref:hypothetical protein n=1 Tax=Tenacibaculum aestuarii TaxID=362781 RepID=UPI0038960C25